MTSAATVGQLPFQMMYDEKGGHSVTTKYCSQIDRPHRHRRGGWPLAIMLGIALLMVGKVVLAADDRASPRHDADSIRVVEEWILTADDGELGDMLGYGVAVDGDTIVVSAPAHITCDGIGAAYVFEPAQDANGSWQQKAELNNLDGARFGRQVAIDGDTIVIGSDRTGPDDSRAGAVYVFERDHGGPNQWGQVAKLLPIDSAPGQHFGHSVAIHLHTIVVGAPYDCVLGEKAGSAYVFGRDPGGGGWTQVVRLDPADPLAYARFGKAVALSADTVVVGAPERLEIFVDSYMGAAYVFERHQGGTDEWGQVNRLEPLLITPPGQLGYSTTIDGNTIVVGAWVDDTAGGAAGSAHVFERDSGGPGVWGAVASLTASDADDGDNFAVSVSLDGDSLMVGAYQDDDMASRSGSAFLFRRNHGGLDIWGEVAKLVPSDGQQEDRFGRSVAISGTVIVGGAYQDPIFGIPGPGKAYVYRVTNLVFVDGFESGGTSAWSGNP